MRIEAKLLKWFCCEASEVKIKISHKPKREKAITGSETKLDARKDKPIAESSINGNENAIPIPIAEVAKPEVIIVFLLNSFIPSKIKFAKPNTDAFDGDCRCCVAARSERSNDEEIPEATNSKMILLNKVPV